MTFNQLLSIIFSATVWSPWAAAADRHAMIVVEQANSTVAFYDSDGWRRLGQVKVGLNPHELALAPDHRMAYVSNFGIQDYDETIGTPGSTVSEIDAKLMAETRQFSTLPERAPHGIKVRSDHDRELFVNTEKPARMLVFDLDTGTVKRRFDVDPKTHNFVFSKDGATLWLMAGPSGVLSINPESGQILAQQRLSTPVRGLALSADQRFLVASGKNEIVLLDAQTLQPVKHFTNFDVGQILYAEPSPDGRFIVAPAVWDSVVLIVDSVTGNVLRRIVSGLDPVAVTFSPDGSTAYVSNARDRGLTKIDLSTFAAQRVETMAGPNGLVGSPLLPDSQQQQPIKFGAILPLSGKDSTFGREMMLGYELWKNDINARGGIVVDGRAYKVATTFFDTSSDPTKVETLASDALADGSQFLLGSYGTPDNGVVAQVAARAPVPLVTSAGAARALYQQGNQYLFGIMAPASTYLIGSLNAAMQQVPVPSRVAIVASSVPAPVEDAVNAAAYAQAHGLAFANIGPDALAAAGLTRDSSGALVYIAGHGNFAAIVAAAKASGVDYFVVAGDLTDSMALVREAKAQNFMPLGLAFSVGPSVPLFASPMGLGPDANHMIGATQWTPAASIYGADHFESAASFAAHFDAAYHARPSYLAAGAYATGLVYENALRRANSLDPAALRHALMATDYETFYGPIKFSDQGLNEGKPLYTIQLHVDGATVQERLLWPPAGSVATWPFPGWAP